MKIFQYFVLSIVIFNSYYVKAQNIEENYQERGLLYNKAKLGGVFIHTRGVGIQLNKQFRNTGTSNFFYETTLSSYKHPKEVRVVNTAFMDAKSYIAGKLHTFTINRWGMGVNKELNIKARGIKNSVSLTYQYTAGVSFGFAKPVYLSILDYSASHYEPIIKDERYNPSKHFPDNIYGRAAFYKGINEIKFYPGLYSKLSLIFDFSKYDETLKSLEIGTALDVYHKKIPIIASEQNNQFLWVFYLGFNFGKRYN